jgi:hypothetical protein
LCGSDVPDTPSAQASAGRAALAQYQFLHVNRSRERQRGRARGRAFDGDPRQGVRAAEETSPNPAGVSLSQRARARQFFPTEAAAKRHGDGADSLPRARRGRGMSATPQTRPRRQFPRERRCDSSPGVPNAQGGRSRAAAAGAIDERPGEQKAHGSAHRLRGGY